ncbi:TPA: TolC family protein [Vibrio vulnificus]|uniref:TolC family protein n=1 Tax=Vibrio vulnificus TaxID=672 RepID=UPI0004F5F9BB|nr:TolC family protein [Vibrio vulnificus]AIL73289.1 outer membrane cation efflux protein [Vibrio vulnificus]EGQ8173035.1 TolC family protein [Vibrio vulnificus]EGR0058405.1 TolC family protein [Vibrio vulnificus]EHU5194760.1 TolC family protein [Vibrio vulnificus]EIN9357562.1 TolC family protein [Vibrio vulnificus]
MKPSLLALCISVSALVATPVMAQSSTAPTGQLLSQSDPLTLLIEQALANDASRKQIFAQSQAMRESGVAASTLMDPKLKVGFGGLPVDSFKFDEDPMTNISVGLMQQFERGSTLELQSKKASQQADGMALQVAAREREVANGITQLWLELGYQQQAERVLLENQRLMRELESFISTNYSIGKSEAQDLLNAQLQVSQLEEKLQANQQMQRRILSQMSEWLGSEWLYQQRDLKASNQLNWDALERLLSASSTTQHFAQLAQHPMVQMANANIAVSQTQVELAQQSYTPQFGVEVMYAYRQASNMKGEPASDLVSAYLTMDIPLFTGNRQDRAHAAAQYQVGAAQSQKDLLLAQMNAKVNALLVDRSNLEQRLERYQNTLLEQAKARTKAVERGYQNSTAQFNDVIAATRDELAVELESQRLLTDLNQVNSNLAMLLGGFTYTVAQPELADIDVNRR